MNKRSTAKRQAILDVAAQVFRESGFNRAHMSEICARVGGSKATLYKHFPSKEELFFEVVYASAEAEFEAAHAALDPTNGNIAEALRHFGKNFLIFLYSPDVRAQRYLAISESARTELGRIVYERGVMRTYRLVSAFLQSAMAQGKLKASDPEIASRHLCSLLEAELIDRFLFQQLDEVKSKEIEKMTERAIDVFMAAYKP